MSRPPLLSPQRQVELVELLASVPGAESYSTRTAILGSGVPTRDEHDPRADFAHAVRTFVDERQSDRFLAMITSAQRRVEGTEKERQLRAIAQECSAAAASPETVVREEDHGSRIKYLIGIGASCVVVAAIVAWHFFVVIPAEKRRSDQLLAALWTARELAFIGVVEANEDEKYQHLADQAEVPKEEREALDEHTKSDAALDAHRTRLHVALSKAFWRETLRASDRAETLKMYDEAEPHARRACSHSGTHSSDRPLRCEALLACEWRGRLLIQAVHHRLVLDPKEPAKLDFVVLETAIGEIYAYGKGVEDAECSPLLGKRLPYPMRMAILASVARLRTMTAQRRASISAGDVQAAIAIALEAREPSKTWPDSLSLALIELDRLASFAQGDPRAATSPCRARRCDGRSDEECRSAVRCYADSLCEPGRLGGPERTWACTRRQLDKLLRDAELNRSSYCKERARLRQSCLDQMSRVSHLRKAGYRLDADALDVYDEICKLLDPTGTDNRDRLNDSRFESFDQVKEFDLVQLIERVRRWLPAANERCASPP